MKKPFITISILILFVHLKLIAQTTNSLTFTEVMFYPTENNGEFIEIYNTSTTQTINLTGYKIKYYTSTADNLVAFIGGMDLAPGKFAVIIENDYDYNNGAYKNIIPADAIVLKISDASFGTSGMANTTSRDISLLDASNNVVDAYTYSADNNAGISDEKFVLNKTNDASNWRNSTKLNGTPGKINSVTPITYLNDLSIQLYTLTPSNPVEKDSVLINFIVKNIGALDASNFSVDIFDDINGDSIKQANEILYTKDFTDLVTNDSLFVQVKFYAASIGNKSIIGKVNFSIDENISNNTSYVKVNISEKPASFSDIVINEIMYLPNNDEPEWLELFNRSDRNINLKNWKITDLSSTTTISASDFVLASGEYLVISNDSTISNLYPQSIKLIVKQLPTFNNSGDQIVLRNSINTTIDSVKYLPDWGGNVGGKSLERVSTEVSSSLASNWKTSESKYKATPSLINSVTQKSYDLRVKSISSQAKYVEAGKSIQLNVIVENIGLNNTANYSVKIFKDRNLNNFEDDDEKIAEQNGSNLSPYQSKEFTFNISEFVVGLNQIIVRVVFLNDAFTENNSQLFKINGVTINEVFGDLIVNEIMYAPTSQEPEWIEIFNRSQKQINLKGYQIANSSTKSKVVLSDVILKPEEYFVIAKDSSIFSKYSLSKNIIITSFPTLSNTKDRVMILDSLDRTIDSLFYKNTWGGTNGKSLERLDANFASVDSSNWKSSLNQFGATPGFINSISKKKYDLAVTNLNFNPVQPIAGENVRISVDISNVGKNDAAFSLILNRINKDSSKTKVEESNSLALFKDSKMSYQFSFVINSINTKQTLEVVANFLADEDLSNNNFTSSVLPGYSKGIVLLNEIMYNPLNGEPEWIELFNNSSMEVDLEEWSITDVLTTPQKQIIKAKETIFPPKSFLVIAKDSTIKNFHREINSKLIITSFANLNNDADGVVIKDSRGTTIDSIRYDYKMGGENGKSLERKLLSVDTNEKSNWGSSKDLELSTPGRINSITIKNYDLTITKILSLPLYPILNQDVSIGAKVLNNGIQNASNFKIKYFKKDNDRFIQFDESSVTNLLANDSLIVYSTNKIKIDDTKTILCKIIFTSDDDTLNNLFVGNIIPGAKQNSILITEVMYDPLTKEPEWIEFYNASNEVINLKDWAISDLLPISTKGIITTKDSYLNPGSYAIATTDTNTYAFIPPKNFYQVKFGSLGNAEDGVIIYDFRNAVIDSFKYKSNWGGGKGISLERISFTKSTNDSTNWTNSISYVGASPGIANTTSSLKKYERGSLIINEIMYEPSTGNPEFVEFYNNSNDTIQVGGMDLRIGDKDKIKLSTSYFVIPSKQFFVLASDSSIYSTYPDLKNYSYVKISKTLSLSNSRSKLFIKDLTGTTLDSLNYLPTWHNRNFIDTKNISLERINPILNSDDKTNWSSCVACEGATPGKANSIFTESLEPKSKVSINPNPFSPDGDGFEDFTIISFNLPYKISQVNIKVFDNQGRMVRTVLSNRPSSVNNSIIFDGLDDNGKALRMGIYILLIEVFAEGSNNVETIKTPIVIARKL